MKLDFIAPDKLFLDKSNMRHGKKPPDVSDLMPTIRKRGILQPLVVRPAPDDDRFGIVAGRRRWTADSLARTEGIDHGPLPCAILDDSDDADAIEASLIENIARLDPDEVTRWATFVRLVKEGRTPEDIAATFGLPDLAVRRVLALGNLLPRIRDLYARQEIDAASIRHLTLASKRQQQDWLQLANDPQCCAPTGRDLKAWLLGGQVIPASHALFDIAESGLATVADLFGEDRYFPDPMVFWEEQNAAVEAHRAAYLAVGWAEVMIMPPGEFFSQWEYEKTSKRKGGRVYIDVRSNGEVSFHEGYVSRREHARAERQQPGGEAKPARPEVTSALGTYIDLHRHAAVRAVMTGHPHVALRLMVAHVIAGSPLWSVRLEPQSTRDLGVCESVETCAGEAAFDRHRRAVLDLLGFNSEEATVTGGDGDPFGRQGDRLTAIFLRLLDVPDTAVLDVVAVVMGETLAMGSPPIDALGLTLGMDMADWWQADPALFDLIRDKEVLGAMVAEVAGPTIASANAGETGKVLKKIVTDHLAGADGRTKVERWVPGWMRFPPAAYTKRGGVGSVTAHARVAFVLAERDRPEPDPAAPAPAIDPGMDETPEPPAPVAVAPEALAA
ncbi:ParB/RepB/Spo0J family partition protein [Sphingomonas sp.]|uniref:ParB/RepB/Spo0J family partition protein n=1 Tax=Sphingomonas sp. TaxID=28214 RepID=UPI003D6CE873